MKALLKTITAFKLKDEIDFDKLADAMAENQFIDRLRIERQSIGFLLFDSGEFLYTQMGARLFQLKIQSALLPPKAVKKELDRRIAEAESISGVKISKSEKDDMKDVIEFEMMQAVEFSTEKQVTAYFKGDMLYIGATGKNVELVTAKLRDALGSLKIEPITFNCGVVTEWLHETSPAPFAFTGNMTLCGASEDTKKERAQFTSMDADSDEIGASLESGKVVRSAELNMLNDNGEASLSFAISEGSIGGLSFANLIEDEANKDDKAAIFDSRVALTVASIKDIFDKLRGNGVVNEG